MGTIYKTSVDNNGAEQYTDLPIKTILVSSSTLVVTAVRTMLHNVGDIILLGTAPSRIDMMLMIDELNPSLVIINDDEAGSMPPRVLETIKLVKKEYPNLNILVLLNNQDMSVELSVLKLGVKGVLSDSYNKKTLIDCIKYTAYSGLWFRTGVMEKFIIEHLSAKQYNDENSNGIILSSFTRRELQITQLASKGYKNREISDMLFISEKTVKHHMSRIFKKLKIEKRTQLKGLIS